MDADGAAGDVLVVLRVVNQDRYLLWSNLSCSIAKDEQHGINHVGFPTSIWANDRRETLYVVYAGQEGRYRLNIDQYKYVFKVALESTSENAIIKHSWVPPIVILCAVGHCSLCSFKPAWNPNLTNVHNSHDLGLYGYITQVLWSTITLFATKLEESNSCLFQPLRISDNNFLSSTAAVRTN